MGPTLLDYKIMLLFDYTTTMFMAKNRKLSDFPILLFLQIEFGFKVS